MSCFRGLKFTVAFFNFLILMVGAALLGFFLWIYFNATIINELANSNLTIIFLIAFMVIGAIIMCLGLLAFCGALFESQCMLGLYIAMLLILLTSQVALSVWCFVNSKKLEGIIQNDLKEKLENYYGDNSLKLTIDAIQKSTKCCGSKGPDDWKYIQRPYKTNGRAAVEEYFKSSFKVPDSCCANMTDTCTKNNGIQFQHSSTDDLYKTGCVEKIFGMLKQTQIWWILIIVTIGVIQILSVIIAIILCITIGQREIYDKH